MSAPTASRGPQPRARRAPTLVFAVTLALSLGACGLTSPTGGGTGAPTPTATPAYNAASGHILVQLFPTPGLLYPPLLGIPSWTLFGDGTLVYTSGGPSATNPAGLDEAQLSAAQVNQILDVVVNQNAFFASSRSSYGKGTPDVGATIIVVDAAGRHKQVYAADQEGSSPDQETKHIYAILQYLKAYQTTGAVPYPIHGVALLAYQGGRTGNQTPRAWPFPDVALSGAYAASCVYLPSTNPCPAPPGGQSGLHAVYGTEAANILIFAGSGSSSAVTQNAADYGLIVYPLLPDSLHPDPGTVAGIQLATNAQFQRVPLLPAPPAS